MATPTDQDDPWLTDPIESKRLLPSVPWPSRGSSPFGVSNGHAAAAARAAHARTAAEKSCVGRPWHRSVTREPESRAAPPPPPEITPLRSVMDPVQTQDGSSTVAHRPPQRTRDGTPNDGLTLASRVIESPGRPLPTPTLVAMSGRFGHDFSNVRVHDGAAAARSARDLGARAYTVDRNVVFGSGEYDPRSLRGRALLAHELTHVVQQGSARRLSVRPGHDEERQWSADD